MLDVSQARRRARAVRGAVLAGLVGCLSSLVGCTLLREWFNVPASYVVSGRVVDYDTGEGISGVLIQFDGEFGTAVTEHDGTWTKEGLRGRVTATPSKEGVLVFDPQTLTLTGPSAGADFVVVLTAQRFEGIARAASEIEEHVGKAYDPGRQAESLAAIAAVARGIEAVEWVESDDSSLSVMYRYGGVQVWLVSPLPETLGASSAPAVADLKRTDTSANPIAVVGNRRAVIVDALYEDPRYESTRQYLEEMRRDLERAGFAVSSWNGPVATVAKMKTLADYGFIFTHGHGLVVKTRHGWKTALQTGERVVEMYDTSLYAWWKGELVLMTVTWGASDEYRSFWAVTATFFEAQSKRFPQSIFVAWNCKSLLLEDLARALQEKGVQAYVGWTGEHKVHTLLARDMVKRLACGETVQDALESIRPALETWYYPKMTARLKVFPEAGREARLVPAGSCLSWEARAPLPTPRAWAPAVAYDGRIYVVGGVACTSGCAQFANSSAALEVYDPRTNRWEELPPMPTPRVGPAVAALDGKIYVMGGFNRDHGTAAELEVRRRVEIYDIATRTWSRGPDLLKPRAWGRGVALGGKVYVLGGVGDYTYSPGYHSGVEVYDPLAKTWNHRAAFEGGRYLHAAVAANGRIYVIGGWKHDPEHTYSDTQEYDPVTDTWRVRSPMPTPAGGFDAVVRGNKIWVFEEKGFCRVYDLATDTWEDRHSGHRPETGFSVVYLDGLVYRFGGGGWGPTLNIVEAARLP